MPRGTHNGANHSIFSQVAASRSAPSRRRHQASSPLELTFGKQARPSGTVRTMLGVGAKAPTSRSSTFWTSSCRALAHEPMSDGVRVSSEGWFSARRQMARKWLSMLESTIRLAVTADVLLPRRYHAPRAAASRTVARCRVRVSSPSAPLVVQVSVIVGVSGFPSIEMDGAPDAT